MDFASSATILPLEVLETSPLHATMKIGYKFWLKILASPRAWGPTSSAISLEILSLGMTVLNIQKDMRKSNACELPLPWHWPLKLVLWRSSLQHLNTRHGQQELWIPEQDFGNLPPLTGTRSSLGVQRQWMYWNINIVNHKNTLRCRTDLNAGVLQCTPQTRLPIDCTNLGWHLHVCHVLFLLVLCHILCCLYQCRDDI